MPAFIRSKFDITNNCNLTFVVWVFVVSVSYCCCYVLCFKGFPNSLILFKVKVRFSVRGRIRGRIRVRIIVRIRVMFCVKVMF